MNEAWGQEDGHTKGKTPVDMRQTNKKLRMHLFHMVVPPIQINAMRLIPYVIIQS